MTNRRAQNCMFPRTSCFRNLTLAVSLIAAALAAGCGGGSSSSGSSTPLPPSISGLSSTTGAIGASITITGANFGSTQGTSAVKFNGTPAATASAWSATSITVNVPAGASTGNVSVIVGIQQSNGEPFEVTFTCGTLLPLGNEVLMNGNFVIAFDGFSDSQGSPAGSGPFQFTGVFTANGSGGIAGGELDAGSVYTGSGTTLYTISSGCYNLGSDQRGLMIWNFAGGSHTFAFAMQSDGVSGRLILFDDFNPGTNPGFRGSADFGKLSLASFSASDLSGSYAFRLAGSQNASTGGTANYQRMGIVGALTFGGSALTVTGAVDVGSVVSGAQQNVDDISVDAAASSFTAPDSFGRGILTLALSSTMLCSGTGGVCTYTLSYYLVGNGDVFLQGLGGTSPLFNGEAVEQSGTFNSAIFNGNSVLTTTGEDLIDHAYTVEAVGQVGSNGNGSANAYLDKESSGTVLYTGTTQIIGGSFAVGSNGMGTLTIGSGSSAQYFDLAMVSQNTAFMLGGTEVNPGTNIMIGMLVPQTVTSSLSTTHLFEFAPVFPATTNVNVVLGTVSATATSLSGTMETSMGLACSTGCLAANQPFNGTYSIDANGRITLDVTSTGGGPFVGWLSDDTTFEGFIPQANASQTFFGQ